MQAVTTRGPCAGHRLRLDAPGACFPRLPGSPRDKTARLHELPLYSVLHHDCRRLYEFIVIPEAFEKIEAHLQA